MAHWTSQQTEKSQKKWQVFLPGSFLFYAILASYERNVNEKEGAI